MKGVVIVHVHYNYSTLSCLNPYMHTYCSIGSLCTVQLWSIV